MPELRKLARPRSVKLDALLNGSCEAVSWQDGVLTLGFYEDKFHKKGVGGSGEPARVRRDRSRDPGGAGDHPVYHCRRSPRRGAKSPLVQHAVETHGAKIVSGDQEH